LEPRYRLSHLTTIGTTHHTVLCDATSAGFTITLPTAASSSGRIYIIKKIDATVNVVTIDGDGSETIDGATTQSLSTQWQTLRIQSNGTSWYVI
jgi:phosphatidate phosphatase APP1